MFPLDRTCDLGNDAPLETAANRSEPMDCGPNVDRTRMAQQPVHMGQGLPGSGERAEPPNPRRPPGTELVSVGTLTGRPVQMVAAPGGGGTTARSAQKRVPSLWLPNTPKRRFASGRRRSLGFGIEAICASACSRARASLPASSRVGRTRRAATLTSLPSTRDMLPIRCISSKTRRVVVPAATKITSI